MLMGEHAVLRGSHALAAAAPRRMTVTLHTRTDRSIRLQSALGSADTSLDAFDPGDRLRFAGAAIRQHLEALPSGFDMEIESQMPPDVGLGSSAAVTAAVLAVLRRWRGLSSDRKALHAETLEAIRAVQGCGSGADAAASIYGGLVLYRAEPPRIEPLALPWPVALLYCGYKTPTPTVIQRVAVCRRSSPALYDRVDEWIDASVLRAYEALKIGDREGFAAAVRINRGLMDALGVCDETLAAMLYALEKQRGVSVAKISGSGLGDCVWALGTVNTDTGWGPPLCEGLDEEGLRVESEDGRDGG